MLARAKALRLGPGWFRLFERASSSPGAHGPAPVEYALPVRSPDVLLSAPKRAAAIRQIKALVSATDRHFETVYRATLMRWAAFAQELPASEAHHHAHQGGLLDHSLDVARRALLIRRQYMLPVGAPPEVATRAADRWTYAAFVSALLHDAGKPATDQEIELYAADGSKIGIWNPWAGPMTPGGYYFMRFRTSRVYQDHETVAAFLAAQLLPQEAIAWVGQDAQVMPVLIGALSHHATAGRALSEIIGLADQQSAASALGGDAVQMPGARRKSLAVVVRETIRDLIDTGEIPINRPGAGGFISDDSLWLVSKRGMDRIRAKLRETGAANIAPRNDTFMDDMQGQGVIIPNSDGRAIWRARVRSPDGNFDQELSFLKFPVRALWPAPARGPEPYEGEVEPKSVEAAATEPRSSESAAAQPANAQLSPDDPDPAQPSDEAVEPKSTRQDAPPQAGEDNSGAHTKEESHHPDIDDGREIARSVDHGGRIRKGDIRLDGEPEAFFDWLARGIREGDLTVNNSKAQLHVVAEGLFLVSPLIFKAYAGEDGPWTTVQKKMIRAGRHIRTANGQNIFLYRVEGKNSASKLRGLVLEDPETFLDVKLPKLNNRLMRMSEF
ncbi:MobH family relaxase [Hyphococcus luteus]|uniref:Relaxase n=1 Tax=Hyphococcus luteus TaxID=2058213 RepID=A0A2S7K033_9PROT|nr:MobH family relaxase [Marinicaulis flavus]PQA85883.1 hypothetical protein CW354_20355 [Marinicaulis flavus]